MPGYVGRKRPPKRLSRYEWENMDSILTRADLALNDRERLREKPERSSANSTNGRQGAVLSGRALDRAPDPEQSRHASAAPVWDHVTG